MLKSLGQSHNHAQDAHATSMPSRISPFGGVQFSYYRSCGSFQLLDMVPSAVPPVRLYVGAQVEDVLSSGAGPAHTAAAQAGFLVGFGGGFDRSAANGASAVMECGGRDSVVALL